MHLKLELNTDYNIGDYVLVKENPYDEHSAPIIGQFFSDDKDPQGDPIVFSFPIPWKVEDIIFSVKTAEKLYVLSYTWDRCSQRIGKCNAKDIQIYKKLNDKEMSDMLPKISYIC